MCKDPEPDFYPLSFICSTPSLMGTFSVTKTQQKEKKKGDRVFRKSEFDKKCHHDLIYPLVFLLPKVTWSVV